MIAYQIAFDLSDNAPQHFINNLQELLPKVDELSGDKSKATSENSNNNNAAQAKQEDTFETRLANLREILSGEITIALHLDFLFRHNRTDLLLLKNIKASKQKQTKRKSWKKKINQLKSCISNKKKGSTRAKKFRISFRYGHCELAHARRNDR